MRPQVMQDGGERLVWAHGDGVALLAFADEDPQHDEARTCRANAETLARDDEAAQVAVRVLQINVELRAFRQPGHGERKDAVVPRQRLHL